MRIMRESDADVNEAFLGSESGDITDLAMKEEAEDESVVQASKLAEVRVTYVRTDSQSEYGHREEQRSIDNPTKLFAHLQQREWGEALTRLYKQPGEAKIWICREEPFSVRWRLLPLHASIVLGAPPYVTIQILKAYPLAARKKDHRGSLPVHLAASRLDIDPDGDRVMSKLFELYPASVSETDRGDCTPTDLAKMAWARKQHGGEMRNVDVFSSDQGEVGFELFLELNDFEQLDDVPNLTMGSCSAEDSTIPDTNTTLSTYDHSETQNILAPKNTTSNPNSIPKTTFNVESNSTAKSNSTDEKNSTTLTDSSDTSDYDEDGENNPIISNMTITASRKTTPAKDSFPPKELLSTRSRSQGSKGKGSSALKLLMSVSSLGSISRSFGSKSSRSSYSSSAEIDDLISDKPSTSESSKTLTNDGIKLTRSRTSSSEGSKSNSSKSNSSKLLSSTSNLSHSRSLLRSLSSRRRSSPAELEHTSKSMDSADLDTSFNSGRRISEPPQKEFSDISQQDIQASLDKVAIGDTQENSQENSQEHSERNALKGSCQDSKDNLPEASVPSVDTTRPTDEISKPESSLSHVTHEVAITKESIENSLQVSLSEVSDQPSVETPAHYRTSQTSYEELSEPLEPERSTSHDEWEVPNEIALSPKSSHHEDHDDDDLDSQEVPPLAVTGKWVGQDNVPVVNSGVVSSIGLNTSPHSTVIENKQDALLDGTNHTSLTCTSQSENSSFLSSFYREKESLGLANKSNETSSTGSDLSIDHDHILTPTPHSNNYVGTPHPVHNHISTPHFQTSNAYSTPSSSSFNSSECPITDQLLLDFLQEAIDNIGSKTLNLSAFYQELEDKHITTIDALLNADIKTLDTFENYELGCEIQRLLTETETCSISYLDTIYEEDEEYMSTMGGSSSRASRISSAALSRFSKSTKSSKNSTTSKKYPLQFDQLRVNGVNGL